MSQQPNLFIPWVSEPGQGTLYFKAAHCMFISLLARTQSNSPCGFRTLFHGPH